MNTTELIKTLIDVSYQAYKKLGADCDLARKLNRHEPIQVDSYEFCYWQEYVCYRVSEYIKEKIPGASVVLELDGNNSTINVELNDEEERKLNGIVYSFLKEQGAL